MSVCFLCEDLMSEEEEKMKNALLKLKELVRQVSITRFKQSAQNDAYNLLEVPKSSEKTVFDHWMSLILISGKSLRVTFKTHFNIKTCRKIASPIYGKKPDDIAVRQAQDFVKEIPAALDSDVGCVPGLDAFPPGVVVLIMTPLPDFFK